VGSKLSPLHLLLVSAPGLGWRFKDKAAVYVTPVAWHGPWVSASGAEFMYVGPAGQYAHGALLRPCCDL